MSKVLEKYKSINFSEEAEKVETTETKETGKTVENKDIFQDRLIKLMEDIKNDMYNINATLQLLYLKLNKSSEKNEEN